MITDVLARLATVRPPLPGPPLTGGLVLGLDRDPSAKVTFVLFDAAGQARAVAKVARRAEAERAVLAEADALRLLWRDPPRTCAAQLPRPLLLGRVAGRLVLATTALPGRAVSVGYYRPGHVRDRRRVARDLDVAGEWLGRFQQDTRRGSVVVGPELWETWVVPVVRRYRAVLGWGLVEQRLLDRLDQWCRELAGLAVPRVTVHGDYAIGNVLVGRTAVSGVVDWELGRPGGSPFTDVLKFLASYGSFLDRSVPPRGATLPGHPGWAAARAQWGGPGVWPNRVGFMHAFFGRGWFPDLVREHLDRHVARIGLPRDVLALALPLFVAEQATVLADPAYQRGYRSVLHALEQVGAEPARRRLEVVP